MTLVMRRFGRALRLRLVISCSIWTLMRRLVRSGVAWLGRRRIWLPIAIRRRADFAVVADLWCRRRVWLVIKRRIMYSVVR